MASASSSSSCPSIANPICANIRTVDLSLVKTYSQQHLSNLVAHQLECVHYYIDKMVRLSHLKEGPTKNHISVISDEFAKLAFFTQAARDLFLILKPSIDMPPPPPSHANTKPKIDKTLQHPPRKLMRRE